MANKKRKMTNTTFTKPIMNQKIGHNQDVDIDDWQQDKSLKERMLHAYTNNFFADVVFLAGKEEVPVKAHKLMLCFSSPVFVRMFHGSFAQSTQKETIEGEDKDLEVIRVPDITSEALNCVLTYIYSEKVELEINIVFNVLYAAKKYLLTGLERECAKFLKDKIDAENVCYILTQAVLYENERLIKTCEFFITADIVKSEGFKNLDETTLARILQFDTLKIGEWTLFQEVLKWAEVQCSKKNLDATPENKRLVLGAALYAIRFPAMRVSEFAAYVYDKKNCILSDSECRDLLLTFTLRDVKLNDTPFNHKPRGFDSNIDVAIYNGIQSSSPRPINGKHSIGFLIKSNARDWFWLTGFGIYGTTSQAENVEITISVEKDKKLISNEVKKIRNLYIPNNLFYGEHRVDMTRPIAIYYGAQYVLNVELNGHYNCYYGCNEKNYHTFLDPKTKEQAQIIFNGFNYMTKSGYIAKLYLGI